MRNIFILILVVIQSLVSIGQTNTPAQKQHCCDSLQLAFVPGNNSDTISYNVLINANGYLVANVYFGKDSWSNSGWNTFSSVQSYEITINDNKTKTIKGGRYNFSNEKNLKLGGTITISNCIVECGIWSWKDEQKPKKRCKHHIKKMIFKVLPVK